MYDEEGREDLMLGALAMDTGLDLGFDGTGGGASGKISTFGDFDGSGGGGGGGTGDASKLPDNLGDFEGSIGAGSKCPDTARDDLLDFVNGGGGEGVELTCTADGLRNEFRLAAISPTLGII